SWTIGAYVNGFTPSYYTRVIWPILWANIHLKDQEVHDKMQTALKYYTDKITPKKSIEDWAFRKNQKAFTHTIAYTIRGLYESSLILNDSELNKTSIMLADKVMKLRELKGKLAGWYDE